MKRVVITGFGLLSPIGNTAEAVTDSLLHGRSGIRAQPAWSAVEGLGSLVAGTVETPSLATIPRSVRRTMGRMAALGALAARDAVDQAGLDQAVLTSGDVGVAFGSTTGSPAALEQFFGQFLLKHSLFEQEGTLFPKVMSHTVAANVAAFLGATGELAAPSSACASSTQAIGLGYHLVRGGHQRAMICGGAEELHPTTAGVFDILHAASRRFNDRPHLTPRPFDRDRDGLVVSEGAGAVVLEAYQDARARGAPILAEILGYATTCDARHMTAPGAEGMARCLRLALKNAGVAPEDLSYVNAHATATELGDAAEAAVLRDLLGPRIPVSSTKGHTGHMLGASGVVETIFCILMMQRGFLAPTLNLEHVGPDCEGLDHVREVRPADVRTALNANFAFGGVNAALVLRKVGETS